MHPNMFKTLARTTKMDTNNDECQQDAVEIKDAAPEHPSKPYELSDIHMGPYRLGFSESLGDGRCLIHSILACMSEPYRCKDDREKTQAAIEVGQYYLSDVSFTDFIKYNLGGAFIDIMRNFREALAAEIQDDKKVDSMLEHIQHADIVELVVNENRDNPLRAKLYDVCARLHKQYQMLIPFARALGFEEARYIGDALKVNILILQSDANTLRFFSESVMNPDRRLTCILLHQKDHWMPCVLARDDVVFWAVPTRDIAPHVGVYL